MKEGGVAAILRVQSNIQIPMEYFQYSSTKYSYLHNDIKVNPPGHSRDKKPPPHIPFCATEPHKKQSPIATHSTLLRPHFSARIFEYYIFRPFRFCFFFFLSFLLFLAVLFVCLSARLMWMCAQLTKKKKNKKIKK